MEDGNTPFYAGREKVGPMVQYSNFNFRLEAPNDSTLSRPAVVGVLHWIAQKERRVLVPFEADYAVLGARFTPVTAGADLLGAPYLTLGLYIPTYIASGLAVPHETTRTFSGCFLPQQDGNIARVLVNFTTGAFSTRVQGRQTRAVHGVIIQGESIDRGLGTVVDFTSLGTCELRPAQLPATSVQ